MENIKQLAMRVQELRTQKKLTVPQMAEMLDGYIEAQTDRVNRTYGLCIDAGEEVQAGVSSVDAMIAVGIDLHFELCSLLNKFL